MCKRVLVVRVPISPASSKEAGVSRRKRKIADSIVAPTSPTKLFVSLSFLIYKLVVKP